MATKRPAARRKPAPAGGPLAGVKVLDFTRVVAGPYCTMQLGDFGAEVIKIEEPHGGDELRALGPPFLGTESVFFLSVNRNKQSIALDLKDPAAIAKIRALVKTADVIVENFRPGVMDRLGLGYDRLKRLNPRLIYCSIAAFHGQSRYRDRPGYDLIISGMSGLQSMTGEPGRTPVRPGVNLVDLTAGTNGIIGILLALIARRATGRGQRIEVSLMDGAFAVLGQLAAIYLNAGTVPGRRPPEDLHPQILPYGTFMTGDDKYLNVCVPNNKFWSAFCEAVDRAAWATDERFATNAERIAHRTTLIPMIAARFREDTRDRWIERLHARDIPAGPVNTIDEAVNDPYLREVGMLAALAHPSCGEIKLPGLPIRLSATPGALRRPPPRLDEHGADVLTQKAKASRSGTTRSKARSGSAKRKTTPRRQETSR